MLSDYVQALESISMFCRIHMNAKRELPIRASEMGMLIYIVQSQQPQTPIKVAEFFKVTKPMVTAMTNSLLQKGYLTKRVSDTDKRSFVLIPTEKAVTLVEETYEEYCKGVAHLKAGMGEAAFDDLIRLLEQANEILGEGK